MKRMFNPLRGDERRWGASAPTPLRPGFHYIYRRLLFALRRGLAWRVAGISRRLSRKVTRTLTLIERRQEQARRVRAARNPSTSFDSLDATRALNTAREREEERRFREELRARSVPAPFRAGRATQNHSPGASSHATSSPGQPAIPGHVSPTAAQLTPPLTTNAGLPICVLKTPPSFTASVMARVSAVNAANAANTSPGPGAARADNPVLTDAPPGSIAPDAPAGRVNLHVPSAPLGRRAAWNAPGGPGAGIGATRVSAEMLWRHALALFGVYGVSALIVLCSGWLFATLAPNLVFSALNAIVNVVILVIAAVGAVWRTSDGAIGGVGLLYLALLALLAPILLVASQAPRVFASARREA